jgi:hypothetical protein
MTELSRRNNSLPTFSFREGHDSSGENKNNVGRYFYIDILFWACYPPFILIRGGLHENENPRMVPILL